MTAKPPPLAGSVAIGAATVAVVTLLCWFGLAHHLPDIVMVYLLGVVVTAMRFGRAASLTAAVLGVAAFDFFFTTPYFSLAVDDARFVLTFAIMLFVALVISTLTERIRRSAVLAGEREARTAALYAMTRELSTASTPHDIVRIAGRHVHTALGLQVTILVPGADGVLAPLAEPAERDALEARVLARAQEVFSAGGGADAELPPARGAHFVPLRASSGAIGVLILHEASASASLDDRANRDLLTALAGQIALSLDRARLAVDEQRSQLEVQKERLRSALLSSVSHDLRTPLAVVKGTATALLEKHHELSAERRREYLETLSDEASRLNLLVDNLLNVTSLESGALHVRKEWQPLEETIGVALNRLEGELRERSVEVSIPTEASLVPVDSTLLAQVFVNLVENAVKYTPAGSPIEIRAAAVDGAVEVQVIDRGPGVPPGQEEQIFGKFHRAAHAPGGIGLGLTICRGIVTVHGGRIWCENREGGGSSFRFLLPRPSEVPDGDPLPETVLDA